MIAKTFFGFEEILAQELKALGAADVVIKNRMVEFNGDLGFMYKANYSLRTALRIQKPVLTFSAKTEGQLYEKFKKFHWEDYLNVDQTFMIDPTVFSDYFTHSHYAALKVKDAIVDRFKEKFDRRPSIDKDAPDVRFNLHISHDKITLSLDSSGESLHKRGYREETGPAPINEVLAAGLLLQAGWDGKGNYLDPMCGSGTMLIEAAMIANSIPAQLHRKHFAFQNWPDYDANLYAEIRNTRINRIKEFEYKIVGYEISPLMAKIAQMNIKSADLEGMIEVRHQDFFTSKKEMFPVLLVFNPPYDERIENNNQDFYKQIGDTLKASYPNTLAWFITSDLQAKKYVGLRPSRKIKVFNGKLECDFLQYEMYEGSKKTKNQND
ncbi:putative N6-adenine-specific DNA methylase [Algoriella xinjiangensis]|uniref:Putative N6-adenine-specific DNA methylase n=1 Tax=Algoriella xinjiangensis TaxID=684065 RepID=A0A1I4SGT0_9FLAO|nr:MULTISPECIES: class I SAM-dependent RNA methyltransferase [Algoriella]MBO6212836.1 class I SAM-dependent RNA methyltransferase [Algoriella sp.]SFM63685.1 putative N6-adenine-specific DNA methylase [Algoriella xinjiangensis]VDH16057.1 Ribosomal RNA large subunit methyltransferase L [Algoriella xinjiangensis]